MERTCYFIKGADWKVRKRGELVDTKKVYNNGLVTVSFLTKEEAHRYRNLVPGVRQTSEMIQWVDENEEEKQILEITASGINRIRVRR